MKFPILVLLATALPCLPLHAEIPDLMEFGKASPELFVAHKSDVTLTADEQLRVEFAPAEGYPGVQIPAPPNGWDLSEYVGVQAEITNDSPSARTINLRVDNEGTGEPYNSGSAKIGPQETKIIQVQFGVHPSGKPVFALDPKAIVACQIFTAKPKEVGAFIIKSVRPFKADGIIAPAAAPAKAASTAAPAGAENTTSPSIGGELLDLVKNADLAGFKYAHTTAQVEGDKIVATFGTGTAYPNVQFAVPNGGWNLSAFGGIEVTVTNTGEAAVSAVLRADNPGDWKQNPWNSQAMKIAPGATETIKLVFGEDNGKAAFPLDSSRINAIQFFLANPKGETVLHLRDLKAYGSPSAVASKSATTLTTPADRKISVTAPEWIGQRPPVDGAWTKTFEDNFDGTALDPSKWVASNSHFSKFFIYQTEMSQVKDGVLKLSAAKKAVDGREYISGQVTGFGKWAQSYGYFEARVKLPTTRGFWPAFWLMPDRDINGPTDQQSIWNRNSTKWRGMEFDILEHLSEWGAGRHNVAVHWDGYGDLHKSWGDTHVYYGPTADGWHNFGMLWEPGKLTWYIDGKKTAEWENERVGDIPGHLLLSLQLGGWATKDIDLTKIDETYDIDYVRVWQRQDLAEAAAKVDLTVPAKK